MGINQYLKGRDPDAVSVSSVNELLNVLAKQNRQVGVVRGVPSIDQYLHERIKWGRRGIRGT